MQNENINTGDYDVTRKQQEKPFVTEETLKSATLQVERKSFILTLKENPRGRFLRITEDVGGRRNSIIIPAPGLEEFAGILHSMVKISDETPPPAVTS